jgi:hypothetical protein
VVWLASSFNATVVSAEEVILVLRLKTQQKVAKNADPDSSRHVPTLIVGPREHVKMWLLGVVVASLVPFLFLIFHGIDGNHLPGLALALVSSRTHSERASSAAYFLIGSVLVVIGEAAWYADITATLLAGKTVQDIRGVCFGSLALFVASVICGGKCVSFSAGAR